MGHFGDEIAAVALVDELFSIEVLNRWGKVHTPSTHLAYRLLMLDRRVPIPSGWSADEIDGRRAIFRDQLETYLQAGKECGLLGGAGSEDLLAKLTGRDDENFRSARAECLAAWFLRSRLGLEVRPRPSGRAGRPLEMLIVDPRGDIHVEVKAPCREPICDLVARKVDDSDILRDCVRRARKQFRADIPNLVFLASQLTVPAFNRGFLVKALYGEEQWVALKDLRTMTVGPFRRECDPRGLFLNQLPDGRHEYTRVSGVLYVEESHEVGADPDECQVMVAHNPFARKRLPEDIWGNAPQCMVRDDLLSWSDESDSQMGRGS